MTAIIIYFQNNPCNKIHPDDVVQDPLFMPIQEQKKMRKDLDDTNEKIKPDFIAASEYRKQANGYQDLGAFGDQVDSLGLPIKRNHE